MIVSGGRHGPRRSGRRESCRRRLIDVASRAISVAEPAFRAVQLRLRSSGVQVAKCKHFACSRARRSQVRLSRNEHKRLISVVPGRLRSMTFASRKVRAPSGRFLSRDVNPRQKCSSAGRLCSRGENRARGEDELAEQARRIRQPAACAPRADWTLPIARRGGRSGNVRWQVGQEPADRPRGRWSRHQRRPSPGRTARRQRRGSELQPSRSPSTFLVLV